MDGVNDIRLLDRYRETSDLPVAIFRDGIHVTGGTSAFWLKTPDDWADFCARAAIVFRPQRSLMLVLWDLDGRPVKTLQIEMHDAVPTA